MSARDLILMGIVILFLALISREVGKRETILEILAACDSYGQVELGGNKYECKPL